MTRIYAFLRNECAITPLPSPQVGFVPGPKDTAYDGGLFMVDIQLDAQYPFVPPKMKFVTRVWHPNISSQTGAESTQRLVRVFEGPPAHDGS